MKSKKMSKAAVCFVITFLVLSFMTFLTSPDAAEKELKIGVLVGLSGTGATWGIGALNCWRFDEKRINNSGGLKIGNDVYTIKLIPEDDKYTASGGRAGAEKLIFRDKVKFILGPISSAAAVAVAPVCEENKVIMLPVCATPKVFTKDTKYVFKMHLPTSIAEYGVPAWIARKYPDVKRIAAFIVNDETGWSSYEYFKLAMKELEQSQPGRLKEAYYGLFDRGTTEFAPFLTKVLESKPDVIDIVGASSTETALIVKQARELGYKGLFSNMATVNAEEVTKVAGEKHAYGVINYSMSISNPPSKELEQYVRDYTKSMGEPPQDMHAFYVDHHNTLLMAIQKARSIDPEKVVAEMESWSTFPTRFGMARWGGKTTFGVNHQIIKPYPICDVKDGRNVMLELITPPSLP